MWGRADRAVKLLGRNIPSVLRLTEGVDLKISRRLCIKSQEESQPQPRSRSPLRVPGHKPTDWEKRFLLWAGHFKKPEDIPETVSIETIRAAKTTLRVKCSYVMIALTILGCIVMVIRGKQESAQVLQMLSILHLHRIWQGIRVVQHVAELGLEFASHEEAVKRHESLISMNLEKKAQWREAAAQSTSAKP